MTRARIVKRFAITIAVACLSWTGVMMVAMPVANADTLPNGLSVTCNQDSDVHATCVVTGCPRVNGDHVVDALHYMVNGGDQTEVGFKCINGATARVGADNNRQPLNVGVQACRKNTGLGEHDDCTPYSSYTFTPAPKPADVPPPPKDVQCPAGSTTPTVPAGQQCTAAAKPDIQCPPGSTTPTVPAGQSCTAVPPPTDAVTMNISVGLGNANVDIASSADIPGKCTYDATAPLLPGVHKTISLGPKGSTSFSTLSPPLLSTYHVVLSCKGQFNGKTVEFGHVEQDVTAAG